MKTLCRKIFGAQAGASAMVGALVVALTGLIAASPRTLLGAGTPLASGVKAYYSFDGIATTVGSGAACQKWDAASGALVAYEGNTLSLSGGNYSGTYVSRAGGGNCFNGGNSAVYFNGKTVDFAPANNADDFTIGFWFHCAANWQLFTNFRDNKGFKFSVDTNSKCVFSYYIEGNTTMQTLTSAASITACGTTHANTTDWNYVAVVRRGETLAMWLNGELTAATDLSGVTLAVVPDTGNLTSSTGGYGAQRGLDDLTIWSRALADNEVRALVTASGEASTVAALSDVADKPVSYFGFPEERGNGRALNLCFTSGTSALQDGEQYGVVPYDRSAWRDVTSYVTGGAVIDDAGTTGMTVTVTGRNSIYNQTSEYTGSTPCALLRDILLDDGGNERVVTVQLAGIPYARYDLYVYMSSATSSPSTWTKNGPIIFEDEPTTYYYMPLGADSALTASAATAWGNATANGWGETKLGTTVIRIPDREGDAFKFTALRMNTSNTARGSVAAIQVIERVPLSGGAWAATIGADVAADALRVSNGVEEKALAELTEEDTLELTVTARATLSALPAGGLSLRAVSVKGGGALTLAGGALTLSDRLTIGANTALTAPAALLEPGVTRVAVAAGGSLTFTAADATEQTFSGVITGSGSVAIASGATLSLPNTASAYTGGTAVFGTLLWTGASGLGSGPVTVEAGGVFDMNEQDCALNLTLNGGTFKGALAAGALTPNQVLSINFASGNGRTYNVGASEVVGAVPVLGSLWQNLTGNNGTAQDVRTVPYGQRQVTGASAQTLSGILSWTSQNTWEYGSNSTSILRGYLDDGNGITVSLDLPDTLGASYGYDLYLYASTDTDNSSFGYKTLSINGVDTYYGYTYADASALTGPTLDVRTSNSYWGSTHRGRTEFAEGINVLRIPGVTEQQLRIKSLRNNNTSQAIYGRGCLAALQALFYRPAGYAGTLTLTAESVIEVAAGKELPLSGATIGGNYALRKVGDGTLKLELTTVSAPVLRVEAGSLAIGDGNALAQTALAIEAGAQAVVTDGVASLTLKGLSGNGSLALGALKEFVLGEGSAQAFAFGGTLTKAEGAACSLVKRGTQTQTLTQLPEGLEAVVEAGTLNIQGTSAQRLARLFLQGGTLGSDGTGALSVDYAEMAAGEVAFTLKGTADSARPAMEAPGDATVSNFTLAAGGKVIYQRRADLASYFPAGFIPEGDYQIQLGWALADELSLPYTFSVLGAAETAAFTLLDANGDAAAEGTYTLVGNTVTITKPEAITGTPVDVSTLSPANHLTFDGSFYQTADSTGPQSSWSGTVTYADSDNGKAFDSGTPYSYANHPVLSVDAWTQGIYFRLEAMQPNNALVTFGNVNSAGTLILARAASGHALTLWYYSAARSKQALFTIPLRGDEQTWQHVLFTRSVLGLKAYLNGEEVAAYAGQLSAPTPDQMQFGAPCGGTNNSAGITGWDANPGAIDDFILWHRVLLPTQAKQAAAALMGAWRWHQAATPTALFDGTASDWCDRLGAPSTWPGDGNTASATTASLELLEPATLGDCFAALQGFTAREALLSGSALTYAPADLSPLTLPATLPRLLVENTLTVDLGALESALEAAYYAGQARVRLAEGRFLGTLRITHAPETLEVSLESDASGLYVRFASPMIITSARFLRTLTGDGAWEASEAWTKIAPDGTESLVDKPEVGGTVILTATAKATLAMNGNCPQLEHVVLLGTGEVAFDFGDLALTEGDYVGVPFERTLLTVSGGIPEALHLYCSALKFGAYATIARGEQAAVATIEAPEGLWSVSGSGERLISINFSDNEGHKITGDANEGLAGYAAHAALWDQFLGTTQSNQTVYSVAFADRDSASAAKTAIAGALNVTAPATWGINGESVRSLFRGYLDDGEDGAVNNTAVTVTLPSDWSARYTAIVYRASESAGMPFTPQVINGTWYTYRDGAATPFEAAFDTIPDAAYDWGSTSVRESYTEGENTLVVSGLSERTFEVKSWAQRGAWWSGGWTARGGLAAIQLKEEVVLVPGGARTFHAQLGSNLSWASLDWRDENGQETGSAPGENDAATITLTGDASLDLSGVSVKHLTLCGNGHAISFSHLGESTVGSWAFTGETTLVLTQSGEELPERVVAYPKRVRYAYNYSGEVVSNDLYEREFSDGFTGALNPLGGTVLFTGGAVRFTGLEVNGTSTRVIFANDVRVTMAEGVPFSFGSADLRFSDNAALTTETMRLLDGGAGREVALTVEDDASITVTGGINNARGGNSLLMPHWAGKFTAVFRDNAKLTAEKAVLTVGVADYDLLDAQLTLLDDAQVRVAGLYGYGVASGSRYQIALRGGHLLIGAAGMGSWSGARPISLTFDGGALGAWQDVAQGTWTQHRFFTSVSGEALFDGTATLTLQQVEPFFTADAVGVTVRGGGLTLEGSVFTALPETRLEGGTLTLAGASPEIPALTLEGGILALEAAFPTVQTLAVNGNAGLRVPLREKLSEGGYLTMAEMGPIPALNRLVVSLVLDPNRAETSRVLPLVPLVLGSYVEGTQPQVKGFGLENNTNSAITDYSVVFTSASAGKGLYAALSGREVLSAYTVTLNQQTEDAGGYGLIQSTVDAYPYHLFNCKFVDARVKFPAAGIAMPHAVFYGNPITLVATGAEPKPLLQGIDFTFSTDVTFDLSDWRDAMDGVARGAVRGLPASLCLVSGGVLKAPSTVRLKVKIDGYTLPEGVEAAVEITPEGIYYVLRSDRRARTLSVNFTEQAVPLAAPPAQIGAYALPIAGWNTLAGVFSSSALSCSDIGGVASLAAERGGNATQLLAYTAQTARDASAPTSLLQVWLDDSAEQTLRIVNVPFAAYRVALVFANDLTGAAYATATIAGDSYAMDSAGYTRRNIAGYSSVDAKGNPVIAIPGDEQWGSTDRTSASAPVVLGHNALVSDVLTGEQVTITLPSFTYAQRYAGLAALQVVEAPDFAAASQALICSYTFSAPGEFALDALTLTDSAGQDCAWANGPENALTLTTDHAVTLTLPAGFEADRILCKGRGTLTLRVQGGGGAALRALNAQQLANVTVDFPAIGLIFAPAEQCSRFEQTFDNAGLAYTIAEGATLALGEHAGIVTEFDDNGTATLDIDEAASRGTLRRDYPVVQTTAAFLRPNLTFAFKNGTATAGTHTSSYNLLVEEGDSFTVPGKYFPNFDGSGLGSSPWVWHYTQTGGSVVFGDKSGGNSGICCFSSDSANSNSSVTFDFSGAPGTRLEVHAIRAWSSNTALRVNLAGAATLALGAPGFYNRGQSGTTYEVALRERGTLEATESTLGATAATTTLYGGRLTTALSEATFTLPLIFAAGADEPTEVAPGADSVLVLSAANSGNGVLSVAQGTLAIADASALGQASVKVAPGAGFEARGFAAAGGAALTWNPADYSGSLRQYYPFEDDNSATKGDNPVALSGSAGYVGAAGRFGQALSTGGGFKVDTASAFCPGTDDFTMSGWFRAVPGATEDLQILSDGVSRKDSDTAHQRGWGLFVTTEGKVVLDVRSSDGTALAVLTSPDAVFSDDGAFQHIAWTRSGTTLALYINGVRVASETFSVANANIAPTADASHWWHEFQPNWVSPDTPALRDDEALDDLAFWGKALTDGQLDVLFRSGVSLASMIDDGPSATSGSGLTGSVTFASGTVCSATAASPIFPYTAAIAGTIAFPEGCTGVTFRLNGETYNVQQSDISEAGGTVTFRTEAKFPADGVIWDTTQTDGLWQRDVAGPWQGGKTYRDGAAVTFPSPAAGVETRVRIAGTVKPASLAFDAANGYRFVEEGTGLIDATNLGLSPLALGPGAIYDVPVQLSSAAPTLSGGNQSFRLLGTLSGDRKTATLIGSGNLNGGTHGVWANADYTGDIAWTPHAGEMQQLPVHQGQLTGAHKVTIAGQVAADGSVSGGTVQFGGSTSGTNWNGGFQGSFEICDGATLDFTMTREESSNAYFRSGGAPLWSKADATESSADKPGFTLRNGATLRFSGCRAVIGGLDNGEYGPLVLNKPIVIGRDSRVVYAYASAYTYTPHGFHFNGDGATLSLSGSLFFMARGATLAVAGIGEAADPSDLAHIDGALQPTDEGYGLLTSGITATVRATEGTSLNRWTLGVGEALNVQVGEGSTLRVEANLTAQSSDGAPDTPLRKLGPGRLELAQPEMTDKLPIEVKAGVLGGTSELTHSESSVAMATGTAIEAGLTLPQLSMAGGTTLLLDPTGATLLRADRAVFEANTTVSVASLIDTAAVPTASANLEPIKIMAWNGVQNADSVTFELATDLVAKGYGLSVERDGLYLMRECVFVRELVFNAEQLANPPETFLASWYAEGEWYRAETPDVKGDYAPAANEAPTALFLLPEIYADGTVSPPKVVLQLTQSVSFAKVRFGVKQIVGGVEEIRPLTVPVSYLYHLLDEPMPGADEAASFTWVPTRVVQTAGVPTLAEVTANVPSDYTYTMRDATVVVYQSAAHPAINLNFTGRSSGDSAWISADSGSCGAVPFAGVYWNNCSTAAGTGTDFVAASGNHSLYYTSAIVAGIEPGEDGQAVTAGVTFASVGAAAVASRRGTGNVGLSASYLTGARAQISETLIERGALAASGVSSGWQVQVRNVPFEAYDLYLIFAGSSDGAVTFPPVRIRLGDGEWRTYTFANAFATMGAATDSWQGRGGLVDGGFVNGANTLHFRFIAPARGATLEVCSIDSALAAADAAQVGLAALQIIRCDDGGANTRLNTGNWSDASGWARQTLDGQVNGRWLDATDEAPRTALIPTTSYLTADMAVRTPYLRINGSASMRLDGSEGVISTGAVDLSATSGGATVNFTERIFASAPNVVLGPSVTFTLPEVTSGTAENDWRWVYDDAARTGESATAALLRKTEAGELVIKRQMLNRLQIDDGTLWLDTTTDGGYTRTAAITGEGTLGKRGPGTLLLDGDSVRLTGSTPLRVSEGTLRWQGGDQALTDGARIIVDGGTFIYYGPAEHASYARLPNAQIEVTNGGTFSFRGSNALRKSLPAVTVSGGGTVESYFNENNLPAYWEHPHIGPITLRGGTLAITSAPGSWYWANVRQGCVIHGNLSVESGTNNRITLSSTKNDALCFSEEDGGIDVAAGATLTSAACISGINLNNDTARKFAKRGAGLWIQTVELALNSDYFNAIRGVPVDIEGGTLSYRIGGRTHRLDASVTDATITVFNGARLEGYVSFTEKAPLVIKAGGTLASYVLGTPASFIRAARITCEDGAVLSFDLANTSGGSLKGVDTSSTVSFGANLAVRLENLPASLTEAVQLTAFTQTPSGTPTLSCPEAVALDAKVEWRTDASGIRQLYLVPAGNSYAWVDATGAWSDAQWTANNVSGLEFPRASLAADTPPARIQTVNSASGLTLTVDQGDNPNDGKQWATRGLVLVAAGSQPITLKRAYTLPTGNRDTWPASYNFNRLLVEGSLWKLGTGNALVEVPVSFNGTGGSATITVASATLRFTHPMMVTTRVNNAGWTDLPAAIDLPAGTVLAFRLEANADDLQIVNGAYDPLSQTLSGAITGTGTIKVEGANNTLTLSSAEDSAVNYEVLGQDATLNLGGNIPLGAATAATRTLKVAAGATAALTTETALGASPFAITLGAGADAASGATLSTDLYARVRGSIAVEGTGVATLGTVQGAVDGDLALDVGAGATLEVGGLWQTPADATSGEIVKRGTGTLVLGGTYSANLPMTIEEGALVLTGNVEVLDHNGAATKADWTICQGAALRVESLGAVRLNGGSLTLESGATADLLDQEHTLVGAVRFDDGSTLKLGKMNGAVGTLSKTTLQGAARINGTVWIDLDALDPATFGSAAGNATYTLLDFASDSARTGTGTFRLGGTKLVQWAQAGWTLKDNGSTVTLEAFGGDVGAYTWAGDDTATGLNNWAQSMWVAPHGSTRGDWPTDTTQNPSVALLDEVTVDGATHTIPEAARTIDWNLPAQTLEGLRCANDGGDYTLTAESATKTTLAIRGELLKTGSDALVLSRPVEFGSVGALKLLGGETRFTSALTAANGEFKKPLTLAGGATLHFQSLNNDYLLGGLFTGDGTGILCHESNGTLTVTAALDALAKIDVRRGTVALTAAEQTALAPEVSLAQGALLDYAPTLLSQGGEVSFKINAQADAAPAGTLVWSAAASAETSRAPRLAAAPGVAAGTPSVNVAELRYGPASGHLVIDPGHAVLPASAKITLSNNMAEATALWMGVGSGQEATLDYAALAGAGLVSVEPRLPEVPSAWGTDRTFTLRLDPEASLEARTFRGRFAGALAPDTTPIAASLKVVNARTGEADCPECRFVLAGSSTDTHLGTLTAAPAVRIDVDGRWAGDVAVAPEGTLGGSGIVASASRTVAVPAGATLTGSTYGNRLHADNTLTQEMIPSTLTVNGTVKMEPESRLRVLVRNDARSAAWVSAVQVAALSLPAVVDDPDNELKLHVVIDDEPGAVASNVKILGWSTLSGTARIGGVIYDAAGNVRTDYTLRQKEDGLYLMRSNARFWMFVR